MSDRKKLRTFLQGIDQHRAATLAADDEAAKARRG